MANLIIFVEVANAQNEAFELIRTLQQSGAMRAGVPLPPAVGGSVMLELAGIQDDAARKITSEGQQWAKRKGYQANTWQGSWIMIEGLSGKISSNPNGYTLRIYQ
jgi:hypothetical protein